VALAIVRSWEIPKNGGCRAQSVRAGAILHGKMPAGPLHCQESCEFASGEAPREVGAAVTGLVLVDVPELLVQAAVGAGRLLVVALPAAGHLRDHDEEESECGPHGVVFRVGVRQDGVHPRWETGR
jgi:hypothetical protein